MISKSISHFCGFASACSSVLQGWAGCLIALNSSFPQSETHQALALEVAAFFLINDKQVFHSQLQFSITNC